VLLAEDNEVNAMVAQAQLAALGLAVTLAPDGEVAATRAAAERFDLILMDCQMPRLDGFTATARIRAAERDAQRDRTPIVALTANAMPDDRERSLAAGMDDHLAKPYREADLVAVLQRHLPAGARG
jgi:CheY-like chemotaxis protein